MNVGREGKIKSNDVKPIVHDQEDPLESS